MTDDQFNNIIKRTSEKLTQKPKKRRNVFDRKTPKGITIGPGGAAAIEFMPGDFGFEAAKQYIKEKPVCYIYIKDKTEAEIGSMILAGVIKLDSLEKLLKAYDWLSRMV